MKASFFPLLLFVSSATLLSCNAVAQTADNAQTNDRLSHLEHDIMLLQRQVSRDGTTPATNSDADVPAGGSAQLEVRLSAIEDQLRELRGKIEETENRNTKLSENFDKLQHDVDFRFNELSGNAQGAAPHPVALAPNASSASNGTPFKQAVEKAPAPQPTAAATSAQAAPEESAHKEDLSSYATPRDLYNYAFRLLNQTQYEEAASVFDAFTKKYAKDPLIGNAFYWEGETYYIRRDYVNSADYFRQGFEALPEGPKAADNLLKLAMSLEALNRKKESCLVLQQITVKFKKSSSSVSDKAEQEEKRIACSKT